MRKLKVASAAITSVLALGGLAACGGGMGDMDMGDDSSTSANSAGFNDADVAFAQGMIPHHQQALEMVELTKGRTLTVQTQQIVNAIKDAQTPEIATMTQWLNDWKKDVPSASDSMSGHDMSDMGSNGMMTDAEMSSLERASDSKFEDMWLEMMIRHHQGAIAMANTEKKDGKFSDAVSLATSIASSQQDEIDEMQRILAS